MKAPARLFSVAALAVVLLLVASFADAQRSRRPVDPALQVAREIARRVPTFRNFRGETPFGVFVEDPARQFVVRETSRCLDELTRLGVGHEAFVTRRSPIPVPVRLEGTIEGVHFRKLRAGADLIVACEFAVRLPRVARILRAHGVTAVDVMSAWRLEPRTSFHTMGMALDLTRFERGASGDLDVLRDYVHRPDAPTCSGVDVSLASTNAGEALTRLACDLAARGGLQTVITPNYSPGHHNHFHIDVRPNDVRGYIR